MADTAPTNEPGHDADLIETLQSLIVAFVLAMTFRGFVVEGFVIPTGSMAPTLMGAHARIQSRQTGWTFAVGMDQIAANASGIIADPMLGQNYAGSAKAPNTPQRRMGDRILVIKSLYPFSSPQRYDVVVFKNPTRSQGDEANYIKRLIGLPNEEIWLCDGDVFARSAGDASFHAQPKPDHVQRAVWQTVHDSDFEPVNVESLNEGRRVRWTGPPWVGDSSQWTMNDRVYRSSSAARCELGWDDDRRPIDDWTPYNMFAQGDPATSPVAVSDVRISATIVPERDGLVTRLELQARSHIIEYVIEPKRAIIRMRPSEEQPGSAKEVVSEQAIELPAAGRAFRVECWHVDQQVRLFIDDEEVVPPIAYDWTPTQRLQNATGVFTSDDAAALLKRSVLRPTFRWIFEGSPVTLHRVKVDRDLFYRTGTLRSPPRGYPDNPTNPGFEGVVQPGMPAYGTHPDNLARLGPDHFMMCGDNSQMSLDSRLWRNPDALISSQIDPAPFVVNRKLLLGKAWVVYFPAPFPLSEGGRSVVPDFGRLRFIR